MDTFRQTTCSGIRPTSLHSAPGRNSHPHVEAGRKRPLCNVPLEDAALGETTALKMSAPQLLLTITSSGWENRKWEYRYVTHLRGNSDSGISSSSHDSLPSSTRSAPLNEGHVGGSDWNWHCNTAIANLLRNSRVDESLPAAKRNSSKRKVYVRVWSQGHDKGCGVAGTNLPYAGGTGRL